MHSGSMTSRGNLMMKKISPPKAPLSWRIKNILTNNPYPASQPLPAIILAVDLIPHPAVLVNNRP